MDPGATIVPSGLHSQLNGIYTFSMKKRRMPKQEITIAHRIIPAVFGFAFLGIGLTVIISLWAAPFGDFMSPPLFFRVFGSFIALVFVVVGGTIGWLAIFATAPVGVPSTPSDRSTGQGHRVANYTCPKCGAPLGDRADVSPSGDAKCTHCGGWFNVHSSSS